MPDIRQEIDDIREAIEAAIDHRQANTWTTVVAKVVEFDKEKMTGKLQPLVKSTVLKPGGATERVSLPQLEDVPIQFSQGGPTMLTHPVKKDDEVVVQVGARMIDNWHEKGDEQDHTSIRSQDLSRHVLLHRSAQQAEGEGGQGRRRRQSKPTALAQRRASLPAACRGRRQGLGRKGPAGVHEERHQEPRLG